MNLGTFSISVSVKELKPSRAFYEALGFDVFDGKAEEGWLTLRNGKAMVGPFQGKFEGNLLTFNPPDVRAGQRKLREAGITPVVGVDEGGEGPAHVVVSDPDGNTILLDQI